MYSKTLRSVGAVSLSLLFSSAVYSRHRRKSLNTSLLRDFSKTAVCEAFSWGRKPDECVPTRPVSSKAGMTSSVELRKQAALWGTCVGDAVAMPVHWYYNPPDIKRDYKGWIDGYRAPNDHHPTSIMRISNLEGGGRAAERGDDKPLIGNVILHDKLPYWTGKKKENHYHQGMNGGDNTLNTLLAVEFTKIMQRVDPNHDLDPEVLRGKVMEEYVRFMTTPGSHSDTYAESFHRLFFGLWSQLDNPPKDGPGLIKFCKERYSKVTSRNEDHQLPSVGGLMMSIPWILHYAEKSEDECASLATEAIKLTHPAPSLLPYVDVYARMLRAVIHGADLESEVTKALQSPIFGKKGKSNLAVIERTKKDLLNYDVGTDDWLQVVQDATFKLGAACYIDRSMPTLLFLTLLFHDNFDRGVLTNANCGGENGHRGASLGALLAANTLNKSKDLDSKWKEGLGVSRQSILDIISKSI